MLNNHRPFMRLIRDVKAVCLTALAVAAVLGAMYALWPIPKQVTANADEIERHQQDEYGSLKENVDALVIEQRVMVEKQEGAAQLTQEVMLRLLDRIDGGH